MSQDDDVTKFFKDLDVKFRKFFNIPPKKDASVQSVPAGQSTTTPAPVEQPPAEPAGLAATPLPEDADALARFSTQVQDTFAKWQEDAKKRNEEFKVKFKDGTDKMKTQIEQNNEKIKNFFDNLGQKWDSQFKTWQADVDKKSAEDKANWEVKKVKMREDWDKFVVRSRQDFDKAVNFNFKMSMKIWLNILLFILPIVVILWLLTTFVFLPMK